MEDLLRTPYSVQTLLTSPTRLPTSSPDFTPIYPPFHSPPPGVVTLYQPPYHLSYRPQYYLLTPHETPLPNANITTINHPAVQPTTYKVPISSPPSQPSISGLLTSLSQTKRRYSTGNYHATKEGQTRAKHKSLRYIMFSKGQKGG